MILPTFLTILPMILADSNYANNDPTNFDSTDDPSHWVQSGVRFYNLTRDFNNNDCY